MAQKKNGSTAKSRTSTARSTKNTKNTRTSKNIKTRRETTPEKKSAARQELPAMDNQTWAIILLACALLLFLVAFVTGDKGWLQLHNLIKGLLGICAFVFPCLLAYIAILTAMEKQVRGKTTKLSLIGAFTLVLSSGFYIFKADIYAEELSYFKLLGKLYDEGKNGEITGILSGIIGVPIYKIFGSAGSRIIISVLIAVLFMIITGVSLKMIIGIVSKPVNVVKNSGLYRYSDDDEDFDEDDGDDSVDDSIKYTSAVRKGRKSSSSYGIDVPLDGAERNKESEGLTAEKFRKITSQSQKSARHGGAKDAVIDIDLDENDHTQPHVEHEKINVEMQEKLEQLETLMRQNNMDNLPDYQIASVIAAELTRRKSMDNKSDPLQKQPDPQTVPVDIDSLSERRTRSTAPVEYQPPKAVPIEKTPASAEDKYRTMDMDIITEAPAENATESTSAEQPEIEYSKKGNKKLRSEISAETAQINEIIAKANEVDKSSGEYRYPPLSLLNPPKRENFDEQSSELNENGQKLIDTLKSFKLSAKIVDICRGPSVTRYEIQPAPGVKISRITNLSDDIALNLAASGVRIEAPIPGKAAVGIEIPNKSVSLVTIRELLSSKDFRTAKSMLSVVLGKDISGNIIVTDLSEMPHLLIAGTTGSGKSVCVNSILLSLLFRATPKDVRIILIDPKMVEFSKYKGIPHLLIPVVSDAKKAAGALNWAVSEMLKRYQLFSEYSVRNIHGYNKLVEQNLQKMDELKSSRPVSEDGEQEDNPEEEILLPNEKLPQIVIAIDELADLMMVAPTEVEEAIFRLAQMARAAGMHLVIATQRPSVNVITGVIKANIPSRIALKVASLIDSRTILDAGGAEKLIGRGDMLFSPVGCPKPIRVQGGYASDEEIENVTDFLKETHTSEYDEEVIEEIERIAAQDIGKEDKKTGDFEESDDPMMEEAIKVVVEAGQASTSLLQRRLRLGYARAGRLIDEMEQMGIVGPHEGSKSRQVLITHQDLLERQNYNSD